MKPNHYARKKRQLKFLGKRLLQLMANQQDHQTNQFERLILKIKQLISELKLVLPQLDLKKILGAAAVFVGLSFSNQVSAQKFAAPIANPFSLDSTDYAALPAFADLDGDGDLDLLVGEYYGKMQYFKNTGTANSPKFAAPLANPFGLKSTDYFAAPCFVDLDGDGDMDLLVGEYAGTLQYFKNTGTKTIPKFAAPQKNPFGLKSVSVDGVATPTFVDLDGDSDFDLLVGEYNGAMKYFENTGTTTSPAFAAPRKNTSGLSSTYYYAFPAFVDLDKDGDFDLLVGEANGNMQYFENKGTSKIPQFATPVENPFFLSSTYETATPTFADLDGDGDMDLLAGESGGVMQYFENTSLAGIKPLTNLFDVKLYPNPVGDMLLIDSKIPVAKVEIINTLGQTVAVFDNPIDQVSVEQLIPGTYAIKILDVDGNFSVSKIVKE